MVPPPIRIEQYACQQCGHFHFHNKKCPTICTPRCIRCDFDRFVELCEKLHYAAPASDNRGARSVPTMAVCSYRLSVESPESESWKYCNVVEVKLLEMSRENTEV